MNCRVDRPRSKGRLKGATHVETAEISAKRRQITSRNPSLAAVSHPMRLLDVGKSVVAEFGAFTSGWTTAGVKALCDGLGGGGPGIHGETMFGARKVDGAPVGGDQLSSSPQWRCVSAARVIREFLRRRPPALCGIAASCGDHPVAGATRVRPGRRPPRLSVDGSVSTDVLVCSPSVRRSRYPPTAATTPPSPCSCSTDTSPPALFHDSTDYISRLLHDDEHPRSASAAPLTQTESELHRSMSAVDLVRTISSIDVSPRVVFRSRRVDATFRSARAPPTRLDSNTPSFPPSEPPSPRSNAL